MRMRYKPRIFVSVYQDDVELYDNMVNALDAFRGMKSTGATVTPVEGVYKGYKEKSMMLYNTQDNLENVLKLAKHFNQESVLITDEEGKGWLRYLDGRKDELIGRLKVSETEPNGDYSKVGREYITFN